MKRSILASLFVLLGLSASTTGCSRAAVICDIICTCEHCNDQEEIESCNQLEVAEDVADAYECGAKWDAYTVCVEERGTCDETEASFDIFNDAGENRCKDESDALDECIASASAHRGSGDTF